MATVLKEKQEAYTIWLQNRNEENRIMYIS
jgi:hypothetical protein